jgi:hypothetical protein
MSGLCHQCGPGGAKKLRSPKDVKQVRMFKDGATGQIVYLCTRCAKELGYV